MGVIMKSNKFRRPCSDDSHGDTSNVKSLTRRRYGKSKPRLKRIFLKASARNLAGKSLRSNAKNKVLHLKKKCIIRRKSKGKNVLSVPLDSREKINQWLDKQGPIGSESKHGVLEVARCVPKTCLNAATSALAKCGDNLNSRTAPEDINSTDPAVLPLNDVSTDPVDGKIGNGESGKTVEAQGLGSENTSCLQSQDQPLHCGQLLYTKQSRVTEPSPEAASVGNLIQSHSKSKVTPKDGDVYESLESASWMKGVCKRPLTLAKGRKSNVRSLRKVFHNFYLKNSQDGYHLALKKFRSRKLTKSLKNNDHGAPTLTFSEIEDDDLAAPEDVPLKVLVKKKLPSSCALQPLGLSIMEEELATPAGQKMVEKIKLLPKRTVAPKVVSCHVPPETSFDTPLPRGEINTPDESLPLDNLTQNLQPSSQRDVCYIFALLDRENDKTLFKCSPHIKSKQVLQQLANIIDTISADNDIVSSSKASSTLASDKDHSECAKTDRSTSPVMLVEIANSYSQTDSSKDSDISRDHGNTPAPRLEEVAEEEESKYIVQTEEGQKPALSSTLKVMISKALLCFAAEVNILTEVSIRLLGWCLGTVKGDLDSDVYDDDLEGFLCHCHDKVSILIECLSVLDSKQILNIDEDEVNRFWLLHDAFRCLLQAYRFIQLPSAPISLSQQLISLMTTCSKMILPGAKTSIGRWISLMTMIRGISNKFCEEDLLSKVCDCYNLFASLRENRSCQTCNMINLYQNVCNSKKLLDPDPPSEKKSLASEAVVARLFPRFSWFVQEVEGLSMEEFMRAFSKHAVVRFSCNEQSGLNPCDEHLSAISCSCFFSDPAEQSQDEHGPKAVPDVACAPDGSKTTVAEDNPNSDHINQRAAVPCDPTHLPSSKEDVTVEKQNENLDSNISLGIILDDTKSVAAVRDESASSSSKDTVIENAKFLKENETQLSVNDCELITLSDENSSSSLNFFLQVGTETGLDNSSSQCSVENCHDSKTSVEVCSYAGDYDSIKNHDKLHSTDSMDNSECQEKNAITTKTASSCSCIDYSPLNFRQAQSKIKNAYSSLNSCSSHVKAKSKSLVPAEMDSSSLSAPDSQSSVMEVSIPDDITVGDDSMFQSSSSEGLRREMSINVNNGSFDTSETEGDGSTSCDVFLNTPCESLRSLSQEPILDSSLSANSLSLTETLERLLDPDDQVSSSTVVDSPESPKLRHREESQLVTGFNHSGDNSNLRHKLKKPTGNCQQRLCKAREASAPKSKLSLGAQRSVKCREQQALANEKSSTGKLNQLSQKDIANVQKTVGNQFSNITLKTDLPTRISEQQALKEQRCCKVEDPEGKSLDILSKDKVKRKTKGRKNVNDTGSENVPQINEKRSKVLPDQESLNKDCNKERTSKSSQCLKHQEKSSIGTQFMSREEFSSHVNLAKRKATELLNLEGSALGFQSAKKVTFALDSNRPKDGRPILKKGRGTTSGDEVESVVSEPDRAVVVLEEEENSTNPKQSAVRNLKAVGKGILKRNKINDLGGDLKEDASKLGSKEEAHENCLGPHSIGGDSAMAKKNANIKTPTDENNLSPDPEFVLEDVSKQSAPSIKARKCSLKIHKESKGRVCTGPVEHNAGQIEMKKRKLAKGLVKEESHTQARLPSVISNEYRRQGILNHQSKSPGSKEAKHPDIESGLCRPVNLDESDPDWKTYLSELKCRYLKQ